MIKSALESKDKGLKMNPITLLHALGTLQAFSDTNWGADKDTRISDYGFIIYFCGIPIAWKSQGMKSVVLSSTEAEYLGVSEVVKELQFWIQLLQTMNIEVQLPIKVNVDNVGPIW